MKKIFALALVATVLGAMFAGCSKAEEPAAGAGAAPAAGAEKPAESK